MSVDVDDLADKDFVAIAPVQIDPPASGETPEPGSDLASLPREKLIKKLGVERWTTNMTESQGEGGAKYVGTGVTGKKGTYFLSYDYARSRDVKIDQASKTYARVGVGVRVKATIYTREKNVSVLGIPALEAAFRSNKLTGSIDVEKFGIESDLLTMVPVPRGDLSVTMLARAQDYADRVNMAAKDEKAVLTPHAFARGTIRPAPASNEGKPKKKGGFLWFGKDD